MNQFNQPPDRKSEVKWGATESQRRLDRRLRNVDERFRKLYFVPSYTIIKTIDALRLSLDEVGLRELAEEWERAIQRFEEANKIGGLEFVKYIAGELDAGRLPDSDKAVKAAIKTFREKQEAERSKAEQQEAGAKFAREEPIRRANEVETLRNRAAGANIPFPSKGPILQQINRINMNAKLRDYRKAVHDIEKAIEKLEQ
ncbi:hypothetical protein A3G53_02765 [Candidatus Nomurabacteria bacterium RIFCSPLOWO2_12_FULL_44_11]|uniref:Uncharacterized protein n=1 Tax=Candidatus Nomurabacteria bacterium RIFCSPLOWO2_12_FULL_44_11 TaxID=1801796 RepID=A0A1F6Y3N9_9BACT|nr:MAG: hypothetical protein A3G53_02765 [Candidatus Nomurabacteria bacterium RIFCSPLOWO2_12_FULL_44_11]